MLMNAVVVLIPVMTMQLATTLKGVIPALVTLDTQGMDFLALVISFVLSKHFSVMLIIASLALR